MSTRYIIKNTKTQWMWSRDDMPNTWWTPEADEAQRYESREDAERVLATMAEANDADVEVVEV